MGVDVRPVSRRQAPSSACSGGRASRSSARVFGLILASIAVTGLVTAIKLSFGPLLEHIPFGWDQPNGMCPLTPVTPRGAAIFRFDGTASGFHQTGKSL